MSRSLFRHRDVSRLEAFSDAVFGFALTLLVVSLETPKTTADLRAMMGGFVPFALMFAMVCWIWYEHNVFFRRYGLEDAWTVFLNAVLLFVVLFYVYPLRFLTMALVGQFFMPADAVPAIGPRDGQFVMFMYSIGVLLIFATFALLHRHVWTQRSSLQLSEAEVVTLRYSTRSHLISMSLAVLSMGLLVLVPGDSQYSGWVYALMGPAHGWNGYQAGKAQERLARPDPAAADEAGRGRKQAGP